jgi:hypothetical protein
MMPLARPASLDASRSDRSPVGAAMLTALSRKHIARRAGLGAARRSARKPFLQLASDETLLR